MPAMVKRTDEALWLDPAKRVPDLVQGLPILTTSWKPTQFRAL